MHELRSTLVDPILMNMISKDLTAASSIPLILSILSRGESYGYEIIQQVHMLSNEKIRWSDGMLYPVLHKIEKHGYATARWKEAKNGRRRKYYRITSKGKKQLIKDQEAWHLISSMLHQLWTPFDTSQ